jgi:hypothetical protein
MARYDHLPIFKKAYDLCLEIEQQVKGFSRDYKYTIGTEIRQLSHEIPALVMVASIRPKENKMSLVSVP